MNTSPGRLCQVSSRYVNLNIWLLRPTVASIEAALNLICGILPVSSSDLVITHPYLE